MTTDPRSGFVVRNSLTPEQYEAERAARVAARASSEPEPTWGQVGQGAGMNTDRRGPFDPSRLADHRYYMEHKAEILAAAIRGEMPGQITPFDPTTND